MATPVAVGRRRRRQSRSVTVTRRRSALDKGKVSDAQAQAIACTGRPIVVDVERRAIERAGGQKAAAASCVGRYVMSFPSLFVTMEEASRNL